VAGTHNVIRPEQFAHAEHLAANLVRAPVGHYMLRVDPAHESEAAFEILASRTASMSRASACKGCKQSTPASIMRPITLCTEPQECSTTW